MIWIFLHLFEKKCNKASMQIWSTSSLPAAMLDDVASTTPYSASRGRLEFDANLDARNDAMNKKCHFSNYLASLRARGVEVKRRTQLLVFVAAETGLAMPLADKPLDDVSPVKYEVSCLRLH